MAPASATPADTAKAQKNCPVESTTKPVMAGAATPARLATKFCRPVHLPAANGPASVCVMAQWLDAKTPYEAQANNSRIRDAVWLGIAVTPRMMVAKPRPNPVQVFRTRLGAAPAAMARSDSQPAAVVAAAVTRYARDPSEAISRIQKWRSRTR